MYCSHIHACYTNDPTNDEYVAHRALQLYELAKFVSATRTRLPGSAAVLVGDLNTCPGSAGMDMILSVTGMVDAFEEANPGLEGAATHNTVDNKCV